VNARGPPRIEPAAREVCVKRLLVVLLLLCCACGPRGRGPALPPPAEVATLGAGDVFNLRIIGEKDLPDTYTVAPDGTVDMPYVGRLHVAGLEPQQVADALRKRLIEEDMLRRPVVSVNVKEYNSKRVEVLGEVQKPGSIPFQQGMTLLRAIAQSGGFTALANKRKVTIRRRTAGGGTVAGTFAVDDIIGNLISDPELQASDSINVGQIYM
jgi:polysaccharide export outer membrane protein